MVLFGELIDVVGTRQVRFGQSHYYSRHALLRSQRIITKRYIMSAIGSNPRQLDLLAFSVAFVAQRKDGRRHVVLPHKVFAASALTSDFVVRGVALVCVVTLAYSNPAVVLTSSRPVQTPKRSAVLNPAWHSSPESSAMDSSAARAIGSGATGGFRSNHLKQLDSQNNDFGGNTIRCV